MKVGDGLILGVIDPLTKMDEQVIVDKGYNLYKPFVMVTYRDGSTREFKLNEWLTFRKGIIENLVESNLANVELID